MVVEDGMVGWWHAAVGRGEAGWVGVGRVERLGLWWHVNRGQRQRGNY